LCFQDSSPNELQYTIAPTVTDPEQHAQNGVFSVPNVDILGEKYFPTKIFKQVGDFPGVNACTALANTASNTQHMQH